MKYKVLIGLTILLLLMSVVVAKEVDEFKVPNGYKDQGNGAYSSNNLGEGLLVLEYNDENIKDYIENDMIDIKKGSDDVMTFDDAELNQHGVMEVVEADGSRFIIIFWAGDNSNIDDNSLESSLYNFNTLNNLEPVVAL